MSKKEYNVLAKPQISSLRIHLCASERSERAIFGVFNSFIVKKVSFFTINVKFKVILSSKSGGGGGDVCTRHPPPTQKSGGDTSPPSPPGFTPDDIEIPVQKQHAHNGAPCNVPPLNNSATFFSQSTLLNKNGALIMKITINCKE